MSLLNLGKFGACLSLYKEFCDRSMWAKNEIPKFYFANLVNRRLNLSTQDSRTVFNICNRVQEKDFYLKPTETQICGIQFLPSSGSESFSEPLLETDATLLSELVYRNWTREDLERKSMSYNAFSGWAGTLLPHKFLPVTSNQFRHTIAYLFDQELKIYHDSDYEYFLHSQKYFLLTKKRLREFKLESIYLQEINEYLRMAFPRCILKRTFEEYDWNWLTHDFHLFVYREVLGLDAIGTRRTPVKRTFPVLGGAETAFERKEILNIYVP